jgi:hypothetical protein
MNTDEPITTAIDHYLSHHQNREDIPLWSGMMTQEFGFDWEKRVWDTKDKLLKLQRDCKDIGLERNLISWGERNTLDDIILTVGFYEISSWSYIDGYVWKVRRDKEPTIPPTLGQQWYHYLGERPPNGVRCSVVVLLSDMGVLFANEIARRIYDEPNRFQDTSS